VKLRPTQAVEPCQVVIEPVQGWLSLARRELLRFLTAGLEQRQAAALRPGQGPRSCCAFTPTPRLWALKHRLMVPPPGDSLLNRLQGVV
jgi:hypothetical protein